MDQDHVERRVYLPPPHSSSFAFARFALQLLSAQSVRISLLPQTRPFAAYVCHDIHG